MKAAIFALTVVSCSFITHGDVSATVKSVEQNWPWDSRVAVTYTISGAEKRCNLTSLSVKYSRGNGYAAEFSPTSFSALSGELFALGNGDHKVVWNPALDTIADISRLVDAEFSVSVTEVDGADSAKPEYLVIDLSGGASAESWPVMVLHDPVPATEEYKTTKLVLKRIRPGVFTQSSPAEEPLRKSFYERSGTVTLTNDYWIGVYELTQRQYELMTGTAGAAGQGGAYPCHTILFSDVRGSGVGKLWPKSSDVDESSLLGKLRAKVALPAGVPVGWKFDLPTEAQWEYACRAGFNTPWNNGKSITVYTNAAGFVCDDGLDAVGWYAANSGGSIHKVGLRMPNRFGLYDMHGNVWEMTLGVISALNNAPLGIEPLGGGYSEGLFPDSGNSYRVVRGGCYKNEAPTLYDGNEAEQAVAICRAAARSRIWASKYDCVGLRIALRYSLDNSGHDDYMDKYPENEYPYR